MGRLSTKEVMDLKSSVISSLMSSARSATAVGMSPLSISQMNAPAAFSSSFRV